MLHHPVVIYWRKWGRSREVYTPDLTSAGKWVSHNGEISQIASNSGVEELSLNQSRPKIWKTCISCYILHHIRLRRGSQITFMSCPSSSDPSVDEISQESHMGRWPFHPSDDPWATGHDTVSLVTATTNYTCRSRRRSFSGLGYSPQMGLSVFAKWPLVVGVITRAEGYDRSGTKMN